MITDPKSSLRAGGIRLRTRSAETLAAASQSFLAQLAQLGLQHDIETTDDIPSPEGRVEKSFHLRAELAQKWAPGLDTTNLTALLQLDTANRADDLDREILLTLLLNPVVSFPAMPSWPQPCEYAATWWWPGAKRRWSFTPPKSIGPKTAGLTPASGVLPCGPAMR